MKLQVTLLFAAASLAGCAYNAPSVFQQTAADDTPEHVKTVLLNAAQEMAWSVCEKAPNHYDLSRKHKIWSIHGDLVLDGTSWTLKVDPERTTLSNDDGTKVHSEANKQIKTLNEAFFGYHLKTRRGLDFRTPAVPPCRSLWTTVKREYKGPLSLGIASASAHADAAYVWSAGRRTSRRQPASRAR